MSQDPFMRPHKPRRNHWVQLGIGAAALLLPPLALGAAFYSMLAGPDEDRARPAQAAAQPAAAVAPQPSAYQPQVGKAADDAARPMEQGIPAPGAPVQVAMTPGANPPVDVEGNASVPPAAENPPASAVPPKRPGTRRARQSQDPFPLKNWLQQIGNLLRNPHGS
jgi:hypothetical protein